MYHSNKRARYKMKVFWNEGFFVEKLLTCLWEFLNENGNVLSILTRKQTQILSLSNMAPNLNPVKSDNGRQTIQQWKYNGRIVHANAGIRQSLRSKRSQTTRFFFFLLTVCRYLFCLVTRCNNNNNYCRNVFPARKEFYFIFIYVRPSAADTSRST